jgi:hypothetical protein
MVQEKTAMRGGASRLKGTDRREEESGPVLVRDGAREEERHRRGKAKAAGRRSAAFTTLGSLRRPVWGAVTPGRRRAPPRSAKTAGRRRAAFTTSGHRGVPCSVFLPDPARQRGECLGIHRRRLRREEETGAAAFFPEPA